MNIDDVSEAIDVLESIPFKTIICERIKEKIRFHTAALCLSESEGDIHRGAIRAHNEMLGMAHALRREITERQNQ